MSRIVQTDPNVFDRLARFFSKLGRKSRTLRRIVTATRGRPSWSKSDIRQFAREGLGNPYVFSAVDAICRGLSEPPPILYRVKGGSKIERAHKASNDVFSALKGNTPKRWSKRTVAQKFITATASKYRSLTGIPPYMARRMALKALASAGELEEIRSHPALDMMARPNGWYQTSWSEYTRAFGMSMLMAGEIFQEPVGNGEGRKVPIEMYILPADEMRPGTAQENNPIPRWHSGGTFGRGGNSFEYSPDPMETEIFFSKLYDPVDPLRGLAPMEAAVRSIDLNNEGRGWNLSFMKRTGVPPVAITGKGTPQQMSAVEDSYIEQTSGKEKAGNIVTLSGEDLKIHQLSMGAADLMWGEVMKLSAKEVAIVFGIPPEILGDSDTKTFSNYQEARLAMYQETILPYLDFMYDSFNSTWLTRFDDGIFLDYDTDQIMAIQADIERAYERLEKANFLTINEKREAVRYPSVPGGDVILIPLTQVPLDTLGLEDDEEAMKFYRKMEEALRDAGVEPTGNLAELM